MNKAVQMITNNPIHLEQWVYSIFQDEGKIYISQLTNGDREIETIDNGNVTLYLAKKSTE
jgi:hypothetical protein